MNIFPFSYSDVFNIVKIGTLLKFEDSKGTYITFDFGNHVNDVYSITSFVSTWDQLEAEIQKIQE